MVELTINITSCIEVIWIYNPHLFGVLHADDFDLNNPGFEECFILPNSELESHTLVVQCYTPG